MHPPTSFTRPCCFFLAGSRPPLFFFLAVAFKLSKRTADENLQSLHSILFGKRAKSKEGDDDDDDDDDDEEQKEQEDDKIAKSSSKKRVKKDSGEKSKSVNKETKSVKKTHVSSSKSKKTTPKEEKKVKKSEPVKAKGKSNKKAKVEPTNEDMHAVVTKILKEVDFNTLIQADPSPIQPHRGEVI
ncbi:hypothetical protein LXL04_029039 [Taraxacum kok-saghyz]